MSGYDSRLMRASLAAIEETATENTLALVSGPSNDHAHYMRRVGLIQGLQLAITICQHVEQQLDIPQPKKEDAPRRGLYED